MPFDPTDSGGYDPGTSAPDINFDPANYTSNLDNGSMQYQDPNFGDLGYTPSPNDESGGLNSMFLKKIGWTGGNPYSNAFSGQQTEAGPTGQGAYTGYTPEFKNFVRDNGLTFKTDSDHTNFLLNAYGKDGKQLGTYTQKYDPDTTFGMVAGALTAAAGGLAGAGLAAGAGYGAGTAVGGAAAGAGAGFAGGLANSGGDIGAGLKGAAVGGFSGGLTQGIDPAGSMGVTDPIYARAINGAVGAGGRAALTGQPIGSSVVGSLTNSGLSAAGQMGMSYLNNDGVDPYQNETNRLSNYPAPQADYSPMADNGGSASMFGNKNYSVAPGTSPYPMSDMISGGDQSPSTQYSADTTGGVMPSNLQNPQQENPVKNMIKAAFNNATAGGAPGRMDNMASNLMDLYTRYKNNSRQAGLADNLNSMFGPDSPYAQRLGIALQRADARSGRNSQIGSRQIELQARLAEQNSRNAPLLNQIYNQQGQNRMGMGSDVFRMLSGNPNGGGGFGMLRDAGSTLNNYFNPPQQAPIDYSGTNDAGGFADGGPVRTPTVGSRSPVRTGGGGGLSTDALIKALSASQASSAPSGMGTLPANPVTDPAAILRARETAQGMARGGSVYGPGGPKTDSIPARLSNGEHVMDADSVNAIGGGNNEMGQARLNALRAHLRGKK